MGAMEMFSMGLKAAGESSQYCGRWVNTWADGSILGSMGEQLGKCKLSLACLLSFPLYVY
jgi:hypothetical protein